MPTIADQSLQRLYEFAEHCLGRRLEEHERMCLAGLAGSPAPSQPPSTASPRQAAADVIEAEKARMRSVIAKMLENVHDIVQRSMQAVRTEEAALRAVEASPTLDQLRPSTLRQPQPGETATEQLLIAQIADRLGNLVRAEVDACFNRRFGRPDSVMHDAGGSAQTSEAGPDPRPDSGPGGPVR